MNSAVSPDDTRERILSVATDMLRNGGYHAVSYRDVAAAVGIKAASVHYHFPSKPELGAAAVARYGQLVMDALGDPLEESSLPGVLFARYVNVFRTALFAERRYCLCGMLSSESAGLPEAVREALRREVRRQVEWLRTVADRRTGSLQVESEALAWLIMSTMEGALSLALSSGGGEAFVGAAATLLSLVQGGGISAR